MKLLKSIAPYAVFLAIIIVVVVDNNMSGRGEQLFPYGFPWRLITIYGLIMLVGAVFAGSILAPLYLFKGRKRAYITGLLIEVAGLVIVGLDIQYNIDQNDANTRVWPSWPHCAVR